MNITERSLKNWIKDKRTDKSMKNELLEKTDFAIKDGLFKHHVSFFHIGADGYVYYMEYYGTGWKKRKPNKDGWIKYLNSLAVNIHTQKYDARSNVF